MSTTVPQVKRPRSAWPLRRWLVAAGSTVAYALLIAIPTDLVDTPVFGREIPPTWWSWPALVVSSVLAGLLTATYVAVPADTVAPDTDSPDADDTADGAGNELDRSAKGGYLGGFLTFFAVGCPVCNKLVLLALGTSGAMTWFEPVQPVLSLAAIAVLAWALRARLRGEASCAMPR
ncbi:MAG TPA: hypothetical protein VFZ64_08670 [Nocardioidaceae bacterium]